MQSIVGSLWLCAQWLMHVLAQIMVYGAGIVLSVELKLLLAISLLCSTDVYVGTKEKKQQQNFLVALYCCIFLA